MAKLKLSKEKLTASVKFEYEFQDGEVKEITYYEPVKKHMEEALKIDNEDVSGQFEWTKKVLEDCLEGERVADIISEQDELNITNFKKVLDEALGKQKMRR